MVYAQAIPIIRAAYLKLFVDLLHESDQVCERILQQCRLPKDMCQRPNAYVPTNVALAFIHRLALCANDTELGIHAMAELTLSRYSPQLQQTLQQTPTLERALENLIQFAHYEKSDLNYRVSHLADEVHILCSSDTGSNSLIEWMRLMPLLTLIREFTGDYLFSFKVTLQTNGAVEDYGRKIFPQTCFVTKQPHTAVILPASLLKFSSRSNRSSVCRAVAANTSWNFPDSLKEIIRTYLTDGYPDIAFVAKAVGRSVRTLQRQLNLHSMSYSSLVHQIKIESAMKLLANNNLRTLDVAYAVGYQDPANFSRAFRSIAGISPKQYRELNYAC